MKLQVLLADDHVLFRDGLRYVLQQLSGQVDIICAGDFVETLNQAESNPCLDLVLMDLNMPGSDGVSSVRIFHQRFPSIPLVVVSATEHHADIEWVMEYGAMAFISKMSSGKEMVSALRIVLNGGVYSPPGILLQSAPNTDQAEQDELSELNSGKLGLTKRQIEVLQYLAEGLSNKEIAVSMNLADGTIKVHIAATFQVLKVNSRIEAVRKGHRLGLIKVARE